MAAVPIGSIGAEQPLLIRQGADFGFTANLRGPDGVTPMNLTGCSARAQIRKRATDSALTIALTCTVVDALTGSLSISLTNLQTAGLVAGESVSEAASKYVWDCEFVDSLGRVIPLFYGPVNVFREVTRG
jgi:hypothetical protein